MSGEKIPINRTLTGLISLGCLGIAAYLFWLAPPDQFAQQDVATGAFMRVGLLMFALWLALPTRNRDAAWANVSPWVFVVIIMAVVGVAVRPKIVVPLLIVMAVFGFVLRPRNKRRSRR
ncbi:hypothetical protein [Gimesia maris]|jgi:hypothetical protein|uniref:Uncharacterized protein n=2 Tax=Gimesia maris TaxID=122 RepID=A0ABX5YVM5_9PLAN|nr:hypothetical protein [Gimesia maris]HAW32598.1 hypothetical protein [Planctomycetaceae bacterium]EDL58439.1 hypothetical protein PM8797T_11796 [Gimesia maris DSM 8797]QDT81987.1 hypothetical protein Mal35_54770 [Gimesia maris]QEG19765.1 hypothetical protein GmarT_56710 [Gimesia maris]QGQ27411.1 hypothetical protein F1729_01385 [Gimesia maris]|tara:strand:+ start:3963 stop:4319 length:357 start_codon:yes stop_codon:yes gene_type:complete